MVTAMLVGAVAASGFVLQRGVGVRAAPAGVAERSRSGAWFCPHGGSDGWRAWIFVTNPGPHDVRVRLTTTGGQGVLSRSAFVLPASTQVQRSVPSNEAGAATEVEYFGGWLGAAAVLQSDGDPPRTATERCVASPHRQWFVTDASTTRGETSYLVVMNPFAEDAAFDVVIRTDRRPAVHPGSLTPLVVGSRTSIAVKLNDFVLQGPNEHLVTGELYVRTGRVVAGGLVISASGLRAEAAAPETSVRWVLPAARIGEASALSLLNPTDRRADLEIVAEGTASQEVLSGIGDVSLGPQTVRRFDLESTSGVGVVVRSTNDIPVVAARQTSGHAGDLATESGAFVVAARWLVMPAVPGSGGSSLLAVQNPGGEDVNVALRLIGKAGPVDAPAIDRLTVPAGRTAIVHLSAAIGRKPISVVVTASGGTVVAGSASYSLGGGAYSATIGEPIPGGS